MTGLIRQKIGNMTRRVSLLLIACVVAALPIYAKITVSSSLETTSVQLNEPFVFTVLIEGENEAFSIRSGDIVFSKPEGLEVLHSYTSSGTSLTMVNGKTTSKKTVTVRYQLVINDPDQASVTIPAVTVSVNGKSYATDPIAITIGETRSSRQQSGETDTVFIDVVASKRNVYLYEKFTVQFYLYIRANAGFGNIQLRAKNGFDAFVTDTRYDLFSQRNADMTPTMRSINGVRYREYKLYEIDALCKKTGTVALPQMHLEGMMRSNDLGFDDDFFGLSTSKGRTVTIVSRYASVQVKGLPQGAPSGFDTIVAPDFGVTASVSADELHTGEALTYTVAYSGDIFAPTIQPPELDGNDLFEVYKPEVERKSGKLVFKYLLIPKIAGDITLPIVKIPYFNTQTGQYDTAQSNPIKVSVKAGGSDHYTSSRGDSRTISVAIGDVVFIQSPQEVVKSFTPAFTAVWYWLLVVGAIAACVYRIRMLLYHKRLSGDERFRKTVHASATAKKWEKQAKKAKGKDVYSLAYNVFLSYLGAKYMIPETYVTVNEMLECLKEQSMSDNMLHEIRTVFTMIEMGRFTQKGEHDTSAFIKRLSILIDRLERGER